MNFFLCQPLSHHIGLHFFRFDISSILTEHASFSVFSVMKQMENVHPPYFGFTLAVAFGSIFFTSKSLLDQSIRLDEVRKGVGVQKRIVQISKEPRAAIVNNARVRFTPVTKGTLLGMSDDGSYLGISESPLRPSTDDPDSTAKCRYFIRYEDGLSHEFETEVKARLQMLGDSSVLVNNDPAQTSNRVTIIRKNKRTEEQLMEDNSSADMIFLSDGNYFRTEFGSNKCINLQTRKVLKTPFGSTVRMNGAARLIAANNDAIFFGTIESPQKVMIDSIYTSPFQMVISNGLNPNIMISLGQSDNETTSFHDVRLTGIYKTLIPEEAIQPKCFGISSNGDALLVGIDGTLFLRKDNEWSNLTTLSGIRAIQKGDYDDLIYRDNRTVFENGTTLINSMKDSENWIYRMEVLN